MARTPQSKPQADIDSILGAPAGELNREGTVPLRGREDRRRRVSFGEHRTKLNVTGLPKGKVGRWVNDQGGRVEEMLDRGYQFVIREGVKVGEGPEDGNSSLDTRVSRIVGKDESGRPIRAYLMATSGEFYAADRAQKDAEVTGLEKSIVDREFGRKAGDGRYKPKVGSTITTGGYRP